MIGYSLDGDASLHSEKRRFHPEKEPENAEGSDYQTGNACRLSPDGTDGHAQLLEQVLAGMHGASADADHPRLPRLCAGTEPGRGVERTDRRGDLLHKSMDRGRRYPARGRHVRAAGGGADDGGQRHRRRTGAGNSWPCRVIRRCGHYHYGGTVLLSPLRLPQRGGVRHYGRLGQFS